MIDLGQWKTYVVRPALNLLSVADVRLNAEWAVNQIVGTTKESGGLTYLLQVPNGPAIGPYQMEPATHDDIWVNYLVYQPELRAVVLKLCPLAGKGKASLMFTDMLYATLMCRIDYWRSNVPAPANSALALATYHKVVYNTSNGASVASEDVDYYQSAIAA
jgi:hypothetical protein